MARLNHSNPLTLIDSALASENQAWPQAEQALLEAVEQGVSFESALQHADPVGRLMAETARDASPATRSALAKASEYLDGLERRFASTAAGTPPVRGVITNLSSFGGQLARPLALRLVQQTDTPHWRTMATLGYLDRHRDPAVVPALVRFAAQTTRRAEQELAVRVLTGVGGPTIATHVRAERDRLAREGRTLPRALAALA